MLSKPAEPNKTGQRAIGNLTTPGRGGQPAGLLDTSEPTFEEIADFVCDSLAKFFSDVASGKLPVMEAKSFPKGERSEPAECKERPEFSGEESAGRL